jgi:hypothetical protein
MHEYDRFRQLMLGFLGFYLAMSIAQLHARQVGLPAKDGLSMARIVASVEWHLAEMGRLQQEQGPVFWPGD